MYLIGYLIRGYQIVLLLVCYLGWSLGLSEGPWGEAARGAWGAAHTANSMPIGHCRCGRASGLPQGRTPPPPWCQRRRPGLGDWGRG